MKNNWAWAEKGATAHIIIGAIAAVGVMHVALRKPPPPKSRNEEVEAPPKGITTAHYIKLINELFGVMNRDETIKEYYWVMDNATIQESLPMQRKIKSGSTNPKS
ncbi:hypothetical protein EDC96DRAFT_572751 [Choanephora cucurbitarum]|nr:hypothetical protein EDC96DRAFT_572751 [Choanephora cucurbitarum]